MSAEKILVVDDEKDFCDFMVAHLQRRGYTVENAYNGADALQCVQTHGPYAVLVTDLNMPQMDGVELLRRGRQHDPQMEAIVISANDQIEKAIAAMREYGAYDYLLKPLVNSNELSMAVGRAMEYRRLRLEREALQAQMLADAERLQILIANTGDAILATDDEGKINIANPAAIQLIGQGDLIGADAGSALPRPLATLVANWKSVGGQRAAVVEVPWGPNSVQMVSLTPLPPGRNGKNGGWVMVLRDVTHLKRLDEYKVRLLAEAANRIQVPLAQALTNTVELNQMADAARSEQFTKTVYSLGRSLDQIRKWMDELILIARVEAGIGVRSETLNVPSLVQEWAQAAIKKQNKDKSLGLNITIEGGVPPIYADRDLMQRLLQQLLDQITAATKPEPGRAVRISVRHQEGQVWIDVTLEGFPIRQTDPLRRLTRPSVISPGALAAGSTAPDLSLAITIAHGMGGQVWVRDQELAGSAIVICFPSMKR